MDSAVNKCDSNGDGTIRRSGAMLLAMKRGLRTVIIDGRRVDVTDARAEC